MIVLVISVLVDCMKHGLVIFLFLLPAYVMSAELSDYYGVWSGTVVEGPVSGKTHDRYDVVIKFVPGKNTVDYPSLNCGGKLHLQDKKGRHFHFRDELEYGKAQCVGNGFTQLQMIDAYRAAIQWFDSNGVLRAKGMLKRSRQTIAL